MAEGRRAVHMRLWGCAAHRIHGRRACGSRSRACTLTPRCSSKGNVVVELWWAESKGLMGLELNLDGLPALADRLHEEIGFVLTQERPLPAWAKPVMRRLRRLMEYRKPPDEHEHSAVSFCRVYQALERAWCALTEAQLKEIGEDDG